MRAHVVFQKLYYCLNPHSKGYIDSFLVSAKVTNINADINYQVKNQVLKTFVKCRSYEVPKLLEFQLHSTNISSGLFILILFTARVTFSIC